ncbi:MAG: helix-turn-helix domain-containing protein, partial [Candidatus Omnitrophota bacterium]|nr:helix-turn-helix domain-containing protein [Candidatus Omnitrophota bacterium]
KELAKRTGLTTSFLSQLERDLTSPSVSSLEKIAQALNTKVGHFFEREETKELIFIKKGIGKQVLDKEKGISCEVLASGMLNIKMQPQVFTLGKDSELTKELMYPGEEKFGMVLKGKVELLYNSQTLTLEEGDSIYCAYTQQLKRMINISEIEAKFLWIVFTSA